MTRRDAESPIQRAMLEALRVAYPDVLVAAIPNGGYALDARTAARLKADGLLAGMPDLGLWWTGGVGLVEVKAPDGRVSPEQRDVHAALTAKGHRVAVCRSVQDLIDILTDWGVPSRLRAA